MTFFVLIVAVACAVPTSFLMWFAVSAVIAVESLSLHDVFSRKFFAETAKNMKISRSTIFVVMVLVTAVFVPMFASVAKRQAADAAAGFKCTCGCRRCEETARKVEGMIKYFALDEDDLRGNEENGD